MTSFPKAIGCGLSVVAALLLSVSAADGQIGFEVRGGAAIGNHTPAAAGLETLPGPSGSAQLDVEIYRGIALYGAYTYAAFECESGFCSGQKVKMTSSGFGGGVRFQPDRLVWARGGFLYHGTDVETTDGVHSVDPAFGYELGAGLSIPVLDRIAIVTGGALRSHLDAADRTTVLTGEIGIRLRLP